MAYHIAIFCTEHDDADENAAFDCPLRAYDWLYDKADEMAKQFRLWPDYSWKIGPDMIRSTFAELTDCGVVLAIAQAPLDACAHTVFASVPRNAGSVPHITEALGMTPADMRRI